MIELTALSWFTITGRGAVAEIEPAQLGDQTIQIGDHILIDGSEKVIVGIESFCRTPPTDNLGLLLKDPH